MADTTPDSGPQGGAVEPAPHALAEVHALNATGAPAPHDSSVVRVDFGAGRGQGGAVSISEIDDGPSSAPPPPPPK